MTDNEIVKALECCANGDIDECQNCPYVAKYPYCDGDMEKDLIDLINRQRAKIERLNKSLIEQELKNNMLYEISKEAKSEAVKEFAERLKTEYAKGMNWFKKKESYYVDVGDIDNLVKEMVGENND